MRLKIKGFSLIEILVSLIIVSLTAVNMAGLQKKIADQQRDNLARAAIVSLVTEKMEKVFSMVNIDQLMAMHNISETNLQLGNTEFAILWSVEEVEASFNHGGDFKDVVMDISWDNAAKEPQHFIHSQQINLALLISGELESEVNYQLAGIIASSLKAAEMIYFEPKVEYKKGAFVIHDSYLYQATAGYSVGDAYPHTIIDLETGITTGSEGWQSYGIIDNPELESNNDLAVLFPE